MGTLIRSAWLCASALVLALATQPGFAQVPLASQDLRLPSDGAGAGTLSVRVAYPASAPDFRYPDGAPVVVYLPGGFGGGSLAAGARLAQQGFVVVTFLYPGGRDGAFRSDGVYDYRGDNCQRAARDVIRFAEAATVDLLGRTIDEVVPGPVLTSIVGLAPYSNGLIGLVALDRYGAAIPRAPYQCGWENPTNDQIIVGDLGTRGKDCDPTVDTNGNGVAGDDGDNPWYDPVSGYGSTTFTLDLSRLAFDPLVAATYTDPILLCPPASRAGAVFHDGRANGRLDTNPSIAGCLDYDGDGRIETTEDFSLGGVVTFDASCGLKLHYSSEVTHALEDRGVFQGSWPSWIATPPEADAFWPLRDVTVHWSGLAARFPDLHLMTTFTKQDHVQSQSDHPHVRQVMDGAATGGLWYRLNPDAAYFQAVNATLPPGYVETPANDSIAPGGMKAHAAPVGTNNDSLQAAGHAEMADRTYTGCWWPELDSTIRPTRIPSAEAGNLGFGADKRTISWPAASGAYCYDVLRGNILDLADDGSLVSLGGGPCVEEDSPDTQSWDAATPPVGSAFFYVVKPNGIHGAYGAASNGHARADLVHACRY